MRNILILLASCFLGMSISAQVVLQSDGAASACSGFFYDSGGNGGGASGNYDANENYELTICPDVPGNVLTVDFTFFDIEDSFEFLTVYNGTGTGGVVLGTYTGTVPPGFFQSSSADGCLTFVFTSDGSFQDAGWEATIACL